MKFSALHSLVVALASCNVVWATSVPRCSESLNLTDSCYYVPLPNVSVSNATRTVPWGEPTIEYANGTTCCSSLDQVRTALDDIDAKLLQLLSTRVLHENIQAAYVREATRFKSTEASVDDPTRNQQVIQGAIDDAPAVGLPQIIAQMVYRNIVNSSVLFEECIRNYIVTKATRSSTHMNWIE
ncbi:hypothetical protein JVU11DRAFT_7523 [Chiua virens]|nr:hypothetical protein JVU11DRAFT_7523 [Chiua virens]